MKINRIHLSVFLLLCLVAVMAILPILAMRDRSTPANPMYEHLGGNFELQSLNGPVQLADYQGKAVMLFFGFTHCPDICPTSMAVMRQVFAALPEQQRDQVQGVFISVDPDRDDVQRLHDYTQFFDPRIVGITGTKAEIDAVTRQYAASYHFEESDSAMGYMVQHTARTYVIDRNGRIHDLISHEAPYTELLAAVRNVL